MFLGGALAQYVSPQDQFEYSQVKEVVFRWGDPEAEDVFAMLLEHDDNPDENIFTSFRATTMINSELWTLVVQPKHFDPTEAYRSPEDYVELPYDAELGKEVFEKYLSTIPTSRQLIGKVGQRWVLFEMGISIEGSE